MRWWAAVALAVAAVYTALIIPFSPRRHPGYHPLITFPRHPVAP